MKKLQVVCFLLILLLTACQPKTNGENPIPLEEEIPPTEPASTEPASTEVIDPTLVQTSELPSDFAIYLLKEEIPSSELAKTDLAALTLQETPLLSTEGIVSYDQETHAIELTPEAYMYIQDLFSTPVGVSGFPFVVAVGDERIYAGAFWTPASSLSFDGVVIMEPFGEEGNVIYISLGYPGLDFYTGKDPRADPRILDALQAAGKLK
jgi:hypothetical protein